MAIVIYKDLGFRTRGGHSSSASVDKKERLLEDPTMIKSKQNLEQTITIHAHLLP